MIVHIKPYIIKKLTKAQIQHNEILLSFYDKKHNKKHNCEYSEGIRRQEITIKTDLIKMWNKLNEQETHDTKEFLKSIHIKPSKTYKDTEIITRKTDIIFMGETIEEREEREKYIQKQHQQVAINYYKIHKRKEKKNEIKQKLKQKLND